MYVCALPSVALPCVDNILACPVHVGPPVLLHIKAVASLTGLAKLANDISSCPPFPLPRFYIRIILDCSLHLAVLWSVCGPLHTPPGQVVVNCKDMQIIFIVLLNCVHFDTVIGSSFII